MSDDRDSSTSAGHGSHGNSVAAWTTVIIMAVGFVLGGVALVIGQWWLFWVSAGLIVVGAIVGKVLSLMGLGSEPSRRHDPSELSS